MTTEVKLPALGESVTEGTVTQWLKAVGDQVAVDEPLLEISTDKVDTEIPSPVAGTLLEIKAAEDETIEIGAVLAVVGDADETGAAASDGTRGQQDAAAPQPEPRPEERQQSVPQEQPGAEQESVAQPTAEQPADQPREEPAAQAPADSGGSAAGGDATEVTLPALGESVTEGTVTQWLKAVGDQVAVDEPLLEISTDKVDTEIPSPVAGTLLEIKVPEDETVEVGGVLALVGSGDTAPSPAQEAAPPSPAEQQPAETAEQPSAEAAVEQVEPDTAPQGEAAPAQPPATPPAPEHSAQPAQPEQAAEQQGSAHAAEPTLASADATRSDGKAYVTPLVRKLASQHNVDLAAITGSGVGGRIRKQDVLAAAEAAAAPAASGQGASTSPAATGAVSSLRGKTEKLSNIRKIIAARMVESLQVSAQLTTVVEVDVTAIARLRERVKASFEQREGVKLSYLPFFAKAAVDALKTYPQVNASIDTDAGTVTYHDAENLSVAVDTEKGLMVPVIKDAGDLSIAGLARKIADVAARTRSNKISPDELTGGTFTLTNTGSRGALFDTPILNQPQVAMLGTGSVVKRPVVIDDENLGETIAVRQVVYLALTYDHRLVDGADAARFLNAVKQRLEEAKFEAELGM
ncbi:MAG: 2-oxoglutarate dehydrogenase, E2 component, dihydrolipoamide succinyltransferase [Nocardioidaceae bacterium]